MSQQANTDMTGKMSAKLGRPGWMLATYGLLGRFSAPVWRLALSVRKRRNKETDTSVTQKLGAPSATRPSGQLVWLHGVSVGESMALRPLIAALSNSRPELHFLLTSSTTTSAAALLQNGLPPRTIHQFAPVDTKSAVDAFLNHWQPDAVAFSERDFWPGLIRWTQEWGQSRNVAPLLINSRMSQDSLKRRTRGATLFRDLLRGFPKILLQDEGSQARFVSLGVPANQLEIVGS
ncbi:MAG: glycosyltransferase N-terminal domain-containing protein, partial [Pseudomonadota bacterium]